MKRYFCDTYNKSIAEDGALLDSNPRCGMCNGCIEWLRGSQCKCFSSYQMPKTHKVNNFRVCNRCGLRRHPAKKTTFTEDRALIAQLDEMGTLDQNQNIVCAMLGAFDQSDHDGMQNNTILHRLNYGNVECGKDSTSKLGGKHVSKHEMPRLLIQYDVAQEKIGRCNCL